jgi:hypothetical protein
MLFISKRRLGKTAETSRVNGVPGQPFRITVKGSIRRMDAYSSSAASINFQSRGLHLFFMRGELRGQS